MPRNMSFAWTTDQIRNRSKTVTRRNGWEFCKVGEVINAVVKSMGLKKGERVDRLAIIRAVDVRRERLDRIITEGDAGTAKEGFPEMPPDEFVDMICRRARMTAATFITRIEFEYVEEDA